MEKLDKEQEALEALAKAAHYWKDKDPKRYKAMLAKLRSERKRSGSQERAMQQVLQAKRREKGGSGTRAGQNGKKGHSKGHMKSDTASAVNSYKKKEKKAGTKLSIDRKDNNRGYESENTRVVPQHLNRGRHNVDPKKLAQWKKRLKKHDLSVEQLLLLAKSLAENKGQEELAKSVDDLILS